MRSYNISERVLQLAWSTRSFRQDGLITQSGSRVDILQPGTLNRLSGPDFSGATLRIDGILLHGDIEIHVASDDWERHNHHLDPAYNSVILHIALDYRRKPVKRRDTTEVPHVNIASRVEHSLMQKNVLIKELPCTGRVETNRVLAEKQLLKSADLYFDDLVGRHLQRIKMYSDHSEPWLMAVFAGFCSVLGVPGNREPMEAVSTLIWNSVDGTSCRLSEDMIIQSTSGWRASSGRPMSRPSIRIKEAICLAKLLRNLDVSELFSVTVDELYELIWQKKSSSSSREVMIATVLIPALWSGHTLKNNHLEARKIRAYWKELPLPLSPEAQKVMWKIPSFSNRKWNKSLNWQYKTMCVHHKCLNCHLGRLV
jgi:hypothetical protein